MRIFDGHSDILTDVTIRRLNGEKNVFKNRHLERIKKGGIEGTILVLWIDPPYDKNPTERMLDIFGAVCEEIDEMKEYGEIALNYNDMEKIKEKGKISIILGMEGLSGLKGNVSLINMLYKMGIRHSMLTWNEENEFATGVGALDKSRGVTELGIKALKRMEDLGIIIDVSHGNEKTFWDIYENTSKPFIASHSNAYSLCKVSRNLKDDQIKAIAERKGVIGINSWPDFIDEKKPTIENLANHIDYIVQLVGIDYIGFGFDFCNFLTQNTTSSFQKGRLSSAIGLEDASKVPKLINILQNRGYKQEDIEKIAFKNFERIIKEILK
ncbi:MAG: dipeptidase [Caloramator sp.]|nr:dipeptidase [Caloramator sp.]